MKEKGDNNCDSSGLSGSQAGIKLKLCDECGNYYPVRDDIGECPVCGCDLKKQGSALA
jgi:hypothetical protein